MAQYLPIAGVAAQIYNAYTKGSGRNEPLEKLQRTKQVGKMLSDLLSGKSIDWADTENAYGLKPKYLSPAVSGVSTDNVNQMVDPRGWSPTELYNDMMDMSSERYQTGGLGNSGYTGNQIQDLFGSLKPELAKSLGLEQLPDWTGHGQGQPMAGLPSTQPTDWGWDKLDQEAKRNYYGPASAGGASVTEGNDQAAKELFDNEQLIKSLNDKYNLGLKTPAERQAELNQRV